jgi:hypothetical protein
MKEQSSMRCYVTNKELLEELHNLRKQIMTAIDDLAASVDALGAAVTVEVSTLAALVAAGNDSAAIEAQVARIATATKALTDSVAPAPVVVPVAPVVEPPVEPVVPTDAPVLSGTPVA